MFGKKNRANPDDKFPLAGNLPSMVLLGKESIRAR